MKNINIIIPHEAEEALNILIENGFDGYIVGGCVRDSILCIEPEDWDITTSALPSQIMECFKDYKIIETGLKHGTVAVIINNVLLEITTYRIDGKYTDNRRPDYVEFTNKIELDLERRDFTINAMAYNHASGLIDFFGGIEDIELKEIKCVGNPDSRFNEDGLRILRALRFASVLGFEIEIETSKSIHRNKELLKNISAERISAEFNKLITGVNFIKIFSEYGDVISVFIPEIKDMIEHDSVNNLYNHTLLSMENVQNDLTLRLVMLFHEIGKYPDADRNEISAIMHSEISSEIASVVLNRLKYDKQTINLVKTLIMYHDHVINPTKKNVKIWLNKIGESIFRKLLEVKKADLKSGYPIQEEKLKEIYEAELVIDEIIKNNQCYSLKSLALRGDDLIAEGIKEGSEIGRILSELLNMVINEELENDREKLLKYAVKNIK